MRIKLLFALSISHAYSDDENKCRHLIFVERINPYKSQQTSLEEHLHPLSQHTSRCVYSNSVGTDAMAGVKIFPGGHSSVLKWQGAEKEHITFGNIHNRENL